MAAEIHNYEDSKVFLEVQALDEGGGLRRASSAVPELPVSNAQHACEPSGRVGAYKGHLA